MESHKDSCEEDGIAVDVAEESVSAVGCVSLPVDVAAFCAWQVFTWSLSWWLFLNFRVQSGHGRQSGTCFWEMCSWSCIELGNLASHEQQGRRESWPWSFSIWSSRWVLESKVLLQTVHLRTSSTVSIKSSPDLSLTGKGSVVCVFLLATTGFCRWQALLYTFTDWFFDADWSVSKVSFASRRFKQSFSALYYAPIRHIGCSSSNLGFQLHNSFVS